MLTVEIYLWKTNNFNRMFKQKYNILVSDKLEEKIE